MLAVDSAMMLLLAALAVVLVYFVQWYLKNKKRMDHWKKLPCVRSRLFFTELRNVFKFYATKNKYDPGVYALELVMAQNHIHLKEGLNTFWSGLTPMVHVFCAELAEKVMVSSLDKSFDYGFFHKWLGQHGLFTCKTAEWRIKRRLLNPCFHMSTLEDFLPVFNEQSRTFLSRIEQRRGEDHVDILPLVEELTLDIVCETVLGVCIGAQNGQSMEYTLAVKRLGDLLNERTTRPWLYPDFLFEFSQTGRDFNRECLKVHNYAREVIRQKKEAFQSKRREGEDGRRRRPAMLDHLLDVFFEGGQLTDEDILYEVQTFMIAGHDTVTAGLTFALYCVGLYPDVQGRLHEELEYLFQGDDDRDVTMDDVRGMKYMDRLLKETQRLYPSALVNGRKLTQDIEHKGFVIPSGTEVYINFLSLHRQPDSFPNPEVFDPDRFLPEYVLKRHPYAYVPFGGGPRNCIGQKFAVIEMKVAMASLLRRFRVVSLDQRDEIRLKMDLDLKPAGPVRLRFLPRTPSPGSMS